MTEIFRVVGTAVGAGALGFDKDMSSVHMVKCLSDRAIIREQEWKLIRNASLPCAKPSCKAMKVVRGYTGGARSRKIMTMSW